MNKMLRGGKRFECNDTDTAKRNGSGFKSLGD